MTAIKPEVVSWGIFYEGVMQDFGYNEEATKAAAELDFHGYTLSIEPLIRLSDYEALQAECERVRGMLFQCEKDRDQYERDAERYRWLRGNGAFAPSAWGNGWALACGSSRYSSVELDASVDAAMEPTK